MRKLLLGRGIFLFGISLRIEESRRQCKWDSFFACTTIQLQQDIARTPIQTTESMIKAECRYCRWIEFLSVSDYGHSGYQSNIFLDFKINQNLNFILLTFFFLMGDARWYPKQWLGFHSLILSFKNYAYT